MDLPGRHPPCTTNPEIAEPISKSDLRANQNSTIELKKVPLIGSAYDVVVVKYPLWRADAEGKCIPEISGICATCKSKYRLLEIGLRSQLEWSEKIGIVGFGLPATRLPAVSRSVGRLVRQRYPRNPA